MILSFDRKGLLLQQICYIFPVILNIGNFIALCRLQYKLLFFIGMQCKESRIF